MPKISLLSLIPLLLSSCSLGDDTQGVEAVFMDEGAQVNLGRNGLSAMEASVQAATAEGLVGLDASGAIVPAIAERWIVTDDAQSYIFRIRNSDWPDGTALTGASVAQALENAIIRQGNSALGHDLSIVSEVRVMAGRVVEIRLKSPMPQFMRLLAQPELGLLQKGKGSGPMEKKIRIIDGQEIDELVVLPPQMRGLPDTKDWEKKVRPVRYRSMSDRQAVELFYNGEADILLGGRYSSLPLAKTGPLVRGTVRLDPITGMFGLRVRNQKGLLSTPRLREAIAMGINREALLVSYPVSGWLPETRLVPAVITGEDEVSPRWSQMSIDQRQTEAGQRIAEWRNIDGSAPALSVYLPQGAGSDQFFEALRNNFLQIGIGISRARTLPEADLELIDQVARYAGSRWFLNQLNCSVAPYPCSAEADALVATATATGDSEARAELLAQAAQMLDEGNYFIALGGPIRWSLVSGGTEGFEDNGWAIHPLFPMADRPN